MRQCGRSKNVKILFLGSRDNNELYIFSDNGIGSETVATASAVAVATTPRTGYVRSVGKERVRKNYGSWTSAQRCSARVKKPSADKPSWQSPSRARLKKQQDIVLSADRKERSNITIPSVSRLLLSMERSRSSPRRRNNTSGVRKEKKALLARAWGTSGIPVWLDRECGYGALE